MSRVVNFRGTTIDYILREMRYDGVADYLVGKNRHLGDWATEARHGVAFSLGDLGVRTRAYRGGDEGEDDFAFFNDFIELTGRGLDLFLGADLVVCDKVLEGAQKGDVFPSDDPTVILFRNMAKKARDTGDRLSYVNACGGRRDILDSDD